MHIRVGAGVGVGLGFGRLENNEIWGEKMYAPLKLEPTGHIIVQLHRYGTTTD